MTAFPLPATSSDAARHDGRGVAGTGAAQPVPTEPAVEELGLEELLELLDDECPADERHRVLEAVVRRTLPLADMLAHRYAGRGLETEDLVQVARTALVGAVHRYRPGAGRGFEAFAVPTIRGELRRHFRDCGWAVRPPRRLQELRAELSATEESLRHLRGRDVTEAELAEALRCHPSEVAEARRCGSGFRPTSLDAPTVGGGTVGASLADPEDAYAALDLRAAVRAEVARLSPRDRLIVDLRFVEERTQSEIGEVLGVSQMQVSRLLSSIVARLGSALSLRPAA